MTRGVTAIGDARSTQLGVDYPSDRRTVEMSRLKLRLLAEGLRVEGHADRNAKPALRVRSGSCGGLDLVLPDGTWVNAPVHEAFARESALRLVSCDGAPTLVVDDGAHVPVTLVPEPAFYSAMTSSETSMRRVGQLCSDRLGVGVTNACTFYRSAASRCRFCSIGMNTRVEQGNKAYSDVLEVVAAAISDPIAPARHVLLGGGTPHSDDTGARSIAELALAISSRWDVSIYAMIAPPADLDDLRRLADSGVNELGMNIEVFSEEAAVRYLPGKHSAIPHAKYWAALEHAVNLFGPVNTRSIAIVGLEPFTETIRGAGELASIGVMPILTPLRPLTGTPLEHHPRVSADKLWDLSLEADREVRRHGMCLGPTCICCQSNTLAVPGSPHYRIY